MVYNSFTVNKYWPPIKRTLLGKCIASLSVQTLFCNILPGQGWLLHVICLAFCGNLILLHRNCNDSPPRYSFFDNLQPRLFAIPFCTLAVRPWKLHFQYKIILQRTWNHFAKVLHQKFFVKGREPSFVAYWNIDGT